MKKYDKTLIMLGLLFSKAPVDDLDALEDACRDWFCARDPLYRAFADDFPRLYVEHNANAEKLSDHWYNHWYGCRLPTPLRGPAISWMQKRCERYAAHRTAY